MGQSNVEAGMRAAVANYEPLEFALYNMMTSNPDIWDYVHSKASCSTENKVVEYAVDYVGSRADSKEQKDLKNLNDALQCDQSKARLYSVRAQEGIVRPKSYGVTMAEYRYVGNRAIEQRTSYKPPRQTGNGGLGGGGSTGWGNGNQTGTGGLGGGGPAPTQPRQTGNGGLGG